MKSFIINKFELIVGGFVLLFFVSYILFSSLSNSLDFKIDATAQKQSVVQEEYDQLISSLAQAQSKDALLVASAGLNLVETTLADGYIDIRPQISEVTGSLANNKQ